MVSFQIPFLQRQLPVEIETERLGGGGLEGRKLSSDQHTMALRLMRYKIMNRLSTPLV